MKRNITFKGNSLTLAGRNLEESRVAPDFKVTAQDLSQVSSADFENKIKVLTSFPSIDTPVCDLQVKEFNKRAVDLSGDIAVIGISKDLPFAQKRFCETFDIKNVRIVSDYKTSSYGINYGLLIKELNLLARSVIIVDKTDTIRYIQLVDELTHAPDYDDALNKLREVLKDPASEIREELPQHCKPCEGGTPALAKKEIERLAANYRGWEIVEAKKILKEFKFRDFIEAKYFLDLVSVIAEEQGHHPAMTIIYNKVKISLTTHAVGGLSENDFIMAKAIDGLDFPG